MEYVPKSAGSIHWIATSHEGTFFMQMDRQEIRQYLEKFDFKNLFTQVLGWDYHTQTLNVTVDETDYLLSAIAQKRGMVVFECAQTAAQKRMPAAATRRKIQNRVANTCHENFIIFTDTGKTTQIWQWARREHGKPTACREHRYNPHEHSGESLIQKLQAIAFSFTEEAQLTIIGVTSRVQASFDIERVTKRFYDHFKREHTAFLKYLIGIPGQEMQKWYASVLLNRLMFIYFIEKKGFLDNDPDYLCTKLTQSQRQGPDGSYKDFLCPLFFEGFAKPEVERRRDVKRLLGKVPYLNGGLFEKHQLETLHGESIEIPDKAFEQLFRFFEGYQWHLDDRPLCNDNEINPDVLGYIFERYINQKQMGAYYTKEDITDYISKNTILPCVFEKARKACNIAFEGESSVWELLQTDPDRYLYDAMKKGSELKLPLNIAAGIDDTAKRTDWNTPAPSAYALPTEIWREVVARRTRYETVRTKLANGEIHDINALITYNLNIRQFAQDVLESCEGPELLRAFWKAITQVTVLDPTCGSGAFLFAALNILEPLYEACLERMQVFLDEVEISPGSRKSAKYDAFRKILEDTKKHPNRSYFILKSIVINNLYGVDIMEEAIEICKLRLFLKMVAQIEDVSRIEPLPDIDFNVQAGNALVGFATYAEVERAVTGKLDFDDTMKRISEKAEDVDRLSFLFREQQTDLGGAITVADKQSLREQLRGLEGELNVYLAGEYGINITTSHKISYRGGSSKILDSNSAYQRWLSSHKPFHWFIAFYGILKAGGFDVIIGNPPYVEYSKVKKEYTIRGYETESCGNLYAFMFERSFRLLQRSGWKSMIIPHSAFCTDRMAPLQDLFQGRKRAGWVSTYSVFPSKLFFEAKQRLAIYIIRESSQPVCALYASRYQNWHEPFREYLFPVIEYANVTQILFQNSVPKIHSELETGTLKKLTQFSTLGKLLGMKREPCSVYFHNTPHNFVRAMDFIPYFWNERDGEKMSTHLKSLYLTKELDTSVVLSVLNSSLFYWWYIVLSNCRDLTMREIRGFPIGIDAMSTSIKQELTQLSTLLMTDLKQKARRKETLYKTTGRVVYDEFYPRRSKPIIDEIDHVLAKHYGFTDEELDFIINYDIKYRMGLGN